jgi:ATP-dependent DNA ligase
MDSQPYKLTDTKPAVYLHYNNKKFWEIKLVELDPGLQTVSRAGALRNNNVEDPETILRKTKDHDYILDALAYIEFHVNEKIKKGYRVRNSDNTPGDKPEKQAPQDQSLGKRSQYNSGVNSESSLIKTSKKPKNEESQKHSRDTNQSSSLFNSCSTEDGNLLDHRSLGLSGFLESRSNQHESVPQFSSNKLDSSEVKEKTKMNIEQPQDKPSMSDQDEEDEVTVPADQTSLSNIRNFKGAYLFRKSDQKEEYFKVQILRRYLKIESGIVGETNCKVDYKIFKDKKESSNEARKRIISKLEKKYVIDNTKFAFTFQKNEITNDSSHEGTKRRAITATHRKNLRGLQDQEESKDLEQSSKFESIADFENKEELSNLKEEEKQLGKPCSEGYDTLTIPLEWKLEDPTGWYLTERLGGIRCFWNGTELWSKAGNKYNPPPMFTDAFPSIPLDGVLYCGKSSQLKCHNIVRNAGSTIQGWSKIKFMVYDAPAASYLPFEERLKILRKIFSLRKKASFIGLCNYIQCKDRDHCLSELEKIENEKGEGIILKNSKSLYTKGRSVNVLEARSRFEKQAIIVGYERKEGETEGPIKSIRVRSNDGKEFLINRGLRDDMRKDPPKVGTVITYKYSGEVSAGKPKAPVFVKINV